MRVIRAFRKRQAAGAWLIGGVFACQGSLGSRRLGVRPLCRGGGGMAGGLCFGKRECDPWSNAAPLFDQVGEVETGDRARGPLLALQVHAVSIGLLGQRRRGEREVMRVRARSRT